MEPDEVDLSLINCLQLTPRASWEHVGKALEVHPATAARRWARLQENGVAWVSAFPWIEDNLLVYVDVTCEAGAVDAIVGTLIHWPHVATVEHMSDGHLQLTVSIADLPALSRYLLQAINIIPGVVATRVQLITRTYTTGQSWTVRSLGPHARKVMLSGTRPAEQSAALRSRDVHAVIETLTHDGRMGLKELAGAIGCSVSTARRRLDAIVAAPLVGLRCDVAQPVSGWPVSVLFQAWLDPAHSHGVGEALASIPEVRYCLSVTSGRPNLAFGVWVRTVDDSIQLEAALSKRLPDLRILNRRIILGTFKRAGQILDADGRRVGSAPVDVWTDPVQAAARALERSR